MSDADAAEQRKQRVARLYSRVAVSYGKIGPNLFAPFGELLVERMHLAPGARVLDVAAGRGAALFPAAAAVGPAGVVVGIDLADPMVRWLAADLRERKVTNATIQQMDAEHLLFADESFDATLCSFALPLFPHPERALAELHRVLRPGGSVGICLPTGTDERWLWYTQLVFAVHQTHRLPMDWVPHVLSPVDTSRLLDEAGFAAVLAAPVDVTFVYASEQQWWDAQWTDAARQPLENMPPAVLDEFKTTVFARLAAMKQLDGLHQRRRASILAASKPQSAG